MGNKQAKGGASASGAEWAFMADPMVRRAKLRRWLLLAMWAVHLHDVVDALSGSAKGQ